MWTWKSLPNMTVYDRTRPRPHHRNLDCLLFSFWKPVIMPIYTEKEPNKYARRIQVNASINLIEPCILLCIWWWWWRCCVHRRTPAIRDFFVRSFRIGLFGGNDFFSFISILHIATPNTHRPVAWINCQVPRRLWNGVHALTAHHGYLSIFHWTYHQQFSICKCFCCVFKL